MGKENGDEIQCGIPDEVLLNKPAVSGCAIAWDYFWPRWFVNDVLEKAYHINDDKERQDPEREAQLAALFAEHGDEMVFVD